MNNNWVSSRVSRWVILAMCLLLVLMSSSMAGAVTSSDSGLTLSPLRTELQIIPGTSVDGVLTITNTTESQMSVTLNSESFSVINPQYDYMFDKETELSRWVRFSEATFDLQKDASRDVTFTVGVPITAEPGGRYISLFASYDTVSSGSEATISRQRVASLLYVTVSGDVTRQGSMLSLTSPAYIDGSKSQWSTSIRNSGTTHFRSRYSVSIENLIGSGSIATMTGNALILPGTIRQVTDVLPLPKLPGIYKVVYTIGLGDTPAVTETRFIVYIPTVVIVVVSVAIVLIVSLLTQKVRKRRTNRSEAQRYKRSR